MGNCNVPIELAREPREPRGIIVLGGSGRSLPAVDARQQPGEADAADNDASNQTSQIKPNQAKSSQIKPNQAKSSNSSYASSLAIQEAMVATGRRAGFQPAGSSGILPEVCGMMTRANTNSRLEAAATGRQDACPPALRRWNLAPKPGPWRSRIKIV
jgi:hypothetical protein